ncbi:MAG: lysyl oxidase family protein [Flavobacteriales bacterium]
MKNVYRWSLFLLIAPFGELAAQCSLNVANDCVCETAGQTNCDLKPDITISWYGLATHAAGPSEYPQTGTNAGRLRVSGSTPNIGHGPLEVRTVSQDGLRTFVCGTDTFEVSGQTNFSCPNGENPKQIIYQRVYRKDGAAMSWSEREAGSMTYHASHGHYHVNDWTTMTLRLEQPGVPDPRDWPVVATGAKIGFCLMDYGSCTSYNGHCRDVQTYGNGNILTTAMFTNQGLYGAYGCGTNVQGISVGRTDIYSEGLDMMWIVMMDGLCNGNYWIVAEVDPTNVFAEETDDNNWTAIPFTLTQQRPAGSGGTASIHAPNGLKAVSGGTVQLTASPGYSYLWTNGATTRSIDVNASGTYGVTVTGPCGALVASPVVVEIQPSIEPPVLTGAEVVGPASATLTSNAGEGDVVWYADGSTTTSLATGLQYTTPVLSSTTTYFASRRSVTAGVNAQVGKTDLTGAVNSSSVKQWLLFDAYKPFTLRSVKVYATGNGERHFALVDNTGQLIAEKVVYVANGTQRVQLDFQVPAGTGHRITAFDDNTEIVQQLHRDNAGVSYPYDIAGLGAITGSTAGAGFYYYLYDWHVTTPDVVNESARVPVTATVTDGVTLDLRLALDGPYNSATGLMSDALRAQGLLPTVEPYTGLGYVHVGGGGEVLSPAVLAQTGPNAVVDWVLVELRDPTQPTSVVASMSAVVTAAGQVIGSGGAPVRFAVPNGSYRVAVRHRNHFGCMTATPVAFAGSAPVLVDMTAATTATHGTDARRNNGGKLTLWSGNVNGDRFLRYTGGANDRDPILVSVGGLVPTNTVTGYLMTDTNLDGVVRYTGSANDRDIILFNIGGAVPTQVRDEQLP